MKIIKGFSSAREILTRRAEADYFTVSAAVKQRLEELFGTGDPETAVRQIIADVRSRGDAALLDYTLRIDGIKLGPLEMSRKQIAGAYREVDSDLVSALKLAAKRINSFHTKQKSALLGGAAKRGSGQLVRPLERVGLYAPGGTASYPSTVLMTAVPAKVAGVGEIILATPPGLGGVVPPATLVAADIAGVDRVFSVGGAQAIAALAFGTRSVPCVDKIFGPGNIFVVLAKKLVFGVVGIDGFYGPSDVLIIADETANPEYCAADLIAQAEHDPLASAVLITVSPGLANEVNREVKQQLKVLTRQAIAAEALNNGGMIVVVSDVTEAVELANLYAPEHLSLVGDSITAYLDKVKNAGCIFIGERSTVVLGDYIAGPSHVLPTGGTARFSSVLNVGDFVKFINLVSIDEADFDRLGRAAITMARQEGLEAHARAVEKRLDDSYSGDS